MTDALAVLSVDIAFGGVVFWIALGLLALFAPARMLAGGLLPLGALGALAMAGAGFVAVTGTPEIMVLPLGLPGLPFHLRLDALSGFFLLLLGAATSGVSMYGIGYFRHEVPQQLRLLILQYHLFLAGMALVILADDAYLFMVACEVMALASYFLVTTDHKIAEIRSAGYLYLLLAHIGAVAILLCFGILQSGQGIGHYTFAAMRAHPVSPEWAGVAFALALFGFGAKAGIVPLHVWLPEAHPAAPSPVSALMSGVMLKTAIYGLLRVTFDLLPEVQVWWGGLALAMGLITALYGVVFAAVQSDMKRLLAYSSIENIGFIVAGIGLSVVFLGYDQRGLAALALTAALYHSLNHALFKSALFLGTGSVLHATGERALGKLGGLIHRMPWVAALTLVAALAIAGIPPLNGFVSEWLLLQAFLLSPSLPQGWFNMVIPVAAGALALAAALAAYVVVKFYGVIFLGQPREEKLAQARDAGLAERLGMLWLVIGCVLLGLFPASAIGLLDRLTQILVGEGIGQETAAGGWIFLTPMAAERASYAPLIFLLVVVAVLALTWFGVRKFYHGRLRRTAPWDCGYPEQTPRMQDTAQGFGQPIRQIFENFFIIEREVPTPFDRAPKYRGRSEDRLWYGGYLPIARLVGWLAEKIGTLQQGRIHIYLLYSFVTLVALLAFVRW
jgi:formate hydrogenlyase subunit 3/multisubunit Na+/H+ antiporter MnhD subunit